MKSRNEGEMYVELNQDIGLKFGFQSKENCRITLSYYCLVVQTGHQEVILPRRVPYKGQQGGEEQESEADKRHHAAVSEIKQGL